MLSDDMRRVRKRMVREGYPVNDRPTNKRARLSIDGAKRESLAGKGDPEGQVTPTKRPDEDEERGEVASSGGNATREDGGYQVQYIDVTEEVNRRLRESRLRQLAESPSTSQKRKYDDIETEEVEGQDTEAGEPKEGAGLELDILRSPTKKIRTSGVFTQVTNLNGSLNASIGKKEDDVKDGPDGRLDRGTVKRRRL